MSLRGSLMRNPRQSSRSHESLNPSMNRSQKRNTPKYSVTMASISTMFSGKKQQPIRFSCSLARNWSMLLSWGQTAQYLCTGRQLPAKPTRCWETRTTKASSAFQWGISTANSQRHLGNPSILRLVTCKYTTNKSTTYSRQEPSIWGFRKILKESRSKGWSSTELIIIGRQSCSSFRERSRGVIRKRTFTTIPLGLILFSKS